jgi:GT2 family glycosyltransferase
MHKKIFVIVVTFNGMQWIEKCLHSVINSLLRVDIIVVDNCSTDGTTDFIKLNFKNVSLIEQNRNLGFGAANNVGLNIALQKGGEYFLLLNQDAYLEKDTITTLVEEMELNQDYGLLSPIHLNGNGDKMDLYFQSYVSPNSCKDFLSDVFLKKNIKNIYNVNFVNAAIWLLSKKTLKEVGGFNPYFFHYAEDNDYVNRCQFKELKVGIVPKAIAYHDRDLINRKFNLKMFININDLKLLNPNNSWSVNKMLKFTLRKIFISMIKLNKDNFYYNFHYFKKTMKNYNLIKDIQKKSILIDYSFLNYNN